LKDPGVVRHPRGLVKVAGEPVPSWLEWKWDGNSLYMADGFSVVMALNGMPPGMGAQWWSEQSDLEVELLAGFPADRNHFSAADLDSLFVGTVDEVEIDWETNVVSVTGRDLTSRFIDNKTSEKFPNQTASQIVETLAGRRGLTPRVTATTTKVGAYYKDNHVRLDSDKTEWDLLTWLAREEGMVVYVQGRELHFEKAQEKATYTVEYRPGGAGETPSGDFVRLKTTRVLTVARDLSVTVRSWNTKQKKAFERKAKRQRAGGGPKGGRVQEYSYSIPGLTPEQAQQRANQLLAELSRHEVRLAMSGPADNLLRKSDLIEFTGTGGASTRPTSPT
jgi:hypothetical protein